MGRTARVLAAALATSTVMAGCLALPIAPPDFVRVEGTQLVRGGEPYSFVGANLWYGCNLGALAEGGDRARLRRELDLLRSLGIDNLRVMGASEGLGQPNTVWPPLQPELGRYDERILDGLDFLLAEMARRDMVAVIYLNNYWEWSGGMAQYVSWLDGEPVPNPFFAENSWDRFMEFSARFYRHAEANAAYRRYIKMLINRKNAYTGVRYRDDPTIMAWQLANEPRPGQGDWGVENFRVFTSWVHDTANFIRRHDYWHLISTGNEGLKGCIESSEVYLDIHRFRNVDYLTAHLWPLNWSWYDPLRHDATYPEAERLAIDYLDQHIALAEQLGKPLVLDEFGIPRDLHSYSPSAPTTVRDRFYSTVLGRIHADAAEGGVFAGSNFWTWGGYGAAADPDGHVWRHGDSFTGDPPQEPQGRNSVFATDASTLAVLERHAALMKAAGRRR
jgi:mannan endo-1,4-beta-mannosidase